MGLVFLFLSLLLALAIAAPTRPSLAQSWRGQCAFDSSLAPLPMKGPCWFDAPSNKSRIDATVFGQTMSEIRWFATSLSQCVQYLGSANCNMDPTHLHSFDFQISPAGCQFQWKESKDDPNPFNWDIPIVATFQGYATVNGRNCTDWRWLMNNAAGTVQFDIYVDQSDARNPVPVQSVVVAKTQFFNVKMSLSISSYQPGAVDPSTFLQGISPSCTQQQSSPKGAIKINA